MQNRLMMHSVVYFTIIKFILCIVKLSTTLDIFEARFHDSDSTGSRLGVLITSVVEH